MRSVKVVAEMPNLKSVPSNYHHNSSAIIDTNDDDDLLIPIIDFSLLSSQEPHLHSKAIQELGRACQQWGFFMVVNHGIEESLMKELIGVTNEFFLMRDEDKWIYKGEKVLDPIKYGTSFNYPSNNNTSYWRDYLKLFVHPQFHSPDQPNNFSDIVREYCEKCRKVCRILLSGISESLGLEEELMKKSLDLESGMEVVNHGIPENLMKAVIECTHEFFNLPEEEKQEFSGKHVLDPIRYGTSFNTCKENVFFWRDFLKVFVHPHFHSPTKPQSYRDVMLEYSEKLREVARKLLGGISESLGLEESLLDKDLELESGLQIFVGNYYPPCPQPQLTMGMPPHSDHGLLTLLIHNQVGGLQVQHQGKWINVNALPNSLLVNTGDHLEIFSNGKYKSNVHRAVVNNKVTRISVATAHGPSLETIVRPASSLIEKENNKSAYYIPMKYKDYLEMQQSNQLDTKSCLERVKIPRS